MPRTTSTNQRTAPTAEIAFLGEPTPQWVSTSMIGLMPGTELVPFDRDSVYLASSPDAAATFWGDSNRILSYYRVLPEEEPVALDSVHGVYRCDRAMIMQELGRGAAGPGLGRHHAT